MASSSRYFDSDLGDKRIVTFPGIGRVYGHSVGSCSHTTGFDLFFKAEGADEATRGMVRFVARVAEDGTLVWVFDQASGGTTRDWRLPKITELEQPYFPPEAMAAMRKVAETLGERDQTAWFFQTIGAIDIELNGLLYERGRLVDTDVHLTGLLEDPSLPKDEFVPKTETEKGFFRPATDEERAARRTTWQANIERSRRKLAAFDAEKGERIVLLKRLRRSMDGFSKRKDGRTVMDLYAAAIAEPQALAA